MADRSKHAHRRQRFHLSMLHEQAPEERPPRKGRKGRHGEPVEFRVVKRKDRPGYS